VPVAASPTCGGDVGAEAEVALVQTGRGPVDAVSTIDGHYGFIGYANSTCGTGRGTVVVTSVRTRVPN